MLCRTILSSVLTIAFLGTVADSPLLSAQEKKAFLTPESAGPDFLVQGEYAGVVNGKEPVGLQVIAKGNGNFDAVLYAGGLPGAGWDGKSKIPLNGKTGDDGVTNLLGNNFKAQIRDGIVTGAGSGKSDDRMYKVFRRSPTLGSKPPEGAIVLFDGTNVDPWNGVRLEDGDLLGVGGRTKQKFEDFHLHLEFRTPFMPESSGQARGNSGMYLLDQYECQVLDSFGLKGLDNECGGIYKASRPSVNMCFPPLSWQTYDVDFQAARFDPDGKKLKKAVVTIRHNGITIHEKLELPEPTPGGSQNDERPGALFLQNHGDPVRYRNIWIVERR
jgi:hypothetical protein